MEDAKKYYFIILLVFLLAACSNDEAETNIEGMDGFQWNALTETEKFDAISNDLNSLEQNGARALEDEYYYMGALDEFYTLSYYMSTPVNEAPSAMGVMSRTMIEL